MKWDMFFNGLRLFLFPNVLGATLIQGATLIPESRVIYSSKCFPTAKWENCILIHSTTITFLNWVQNTLVQKLNDPVLVGNNVFQ